VQIASIPEEIRGYGHIKTRNLNAARQKEAKLLASFGVRGSAASSLIATRQRANGQPVPAGRSRRWCRSRAVGQARRRKDIQFARNAAGSGCRDRCEQA
jgi:hypothetical protein